MKTLLDNLYMAWVIGTKDILDTLKNRASRTNIVVMAAMVVFFYWLGVLRPFDRGVSVVVYDEATSPALQAVKLADGAEYSFREASSLQDMERKMANQNLGLVLPANLSQTLSAGGTPTLSGYIFWADRSKAAALETKYTQAFSEILDQPVQLVIDRNIIIPQADADGMQTTIAAQFIYFIFWTGLFLIPYLMLEEKKTRTLDALLTSPASPGQVVLGKVLAGFFYILIIGGLAVALYSQFIVHWGLALAAFLGYALFATALGLAVGSLIKSNKQLGLWALVLLLFLEIPPLFYMEPNLKAGIHAVLSWCPSTALARLFRFACSTDATPAQLLVNLAIAGVSIAAVFGLVVWRVRRSDR
jgi:ABC-type Na+ efflux pump permease subunit